MSAAIVKDDLKVRQDDILVSGDEVRIGDTIVGTQNQKTLVRKSCFSAFVCTRIDSINCYWVINDSGTEAVILTIKHTDHKYYIRARNNARSSEKEAAESISEYPHKCFYCGQQAYIGFLGVAHENETQSSGCTARRV